jgi:ribosomal protein S18 acetylase RimI-like enzyme
MTVTLHTPPSKFAVRTLQSDADVKLYQELFLQSEVLIHLGRELGDENMTAIGSAYTMKQFEEDLQSLQSIERVYSSGGGGFWVLWDTEVNVMVGSIALEIHSNGHGELRRMCISPLYRRQGLGKLLLEHFFAYIRESCLNLYEDGKFRVHLGTPAINTPALRLYESFGFQVEKSFTVKCEPGNSTLDLVELAVVITSSSEV